MSGQRLDLLIIGGGVNGCGIARDAAGRGLSILLVEQGDLAQATSSASTKLFHGGLRYLEHYEFHLVREALIERETLLRAMPHISRPLRFLLPHHAGLRPAWLLRLGLFLYDHLGGRKILPGARTLDLRVDPAGAPLKPAYIKGFEYSDCWVDDSRLVTLNAVDAARKGAQIETRTRCIGAERDGALWRVKLENAETGERRVVCAQGTVNAAGPWAGSMLRSMLGSTTAKEKVRLVRGSHIVVPSLYNHDRAYIFQNADERIVFAIPYEADFTLIGTTDCDHVGQPCEAVCTEEETAYLCAAVSQYFRKPVVPADVIWSYSGVRPLYDDGAASASATTRDYVLRVDDADGAAPLLSVFGGKITTYRRLAEAALAALAPHYPAMGAPWTASAPLPGGGLSVDGLDDLAARLAGEYPYLDAAWAGRLVRAYGTEAFEMLKDTRKRESLGRDFGATLTEREVVWMMEQEWARSAEDALWRRSKLGLRLSPEQTRALGEWMNARRAAHREVA